MFAVLRRSFFNVAVKYSKQNIQICANAKETSGKLRLLCNYSIQQQHNYSTNGNMSKTALVILAPGAEEMEFVISADVLRRAGIQVTVAGLNGKDPVKCSRDVVIVPDTSLEAAKANKYDVVILPGGLGGSKAMAESALVGELLKQQEADGRIVAAICAAPTALVAHGICTGKCLTSYPSVKSQLESKYKYVEGQKVVHDGNLITSRGPGTAFDFGLKIAEVLTGADKACEVAKGMLLA